MSEQKRTNRTDTEWAALVAAFKASGQTQAAFCEQRGINVSSFRRRYQRSEQLTDKRRRPPVAAFAELTPPSPAASVGLVVRVGERVRIECPAQMDVVAVAKLVRGLTDEL
jgi:hypothetical protein